MYRLFVYRVLDEDGDSLSAELSDLSRGDYESRRQPETDELELDCELGKDNWEYENEIPLDYSPDDCQESGYLEALELIRRIDLASSGNIPMECLLLEVVKLAYTAGARAERDRIAK